MFHPYFFDVELVRLALLVSVVVSLLAYKKFGVTTGAMIVPGYMASFMHRPGQIAATFLLAFGVYIVVYQQIRPRLMVWGRKLLEIEIFVGLLFQIIYFGLLLLIMDDIPQLSLFVSVGFLIPALIAHDMGRQGVRTTITTIILSSALVFGLVYLVELLRTGLITSGILADLSLVRQTTPFAFPSRLLLVAIGLSCAISWAWYRGAFFGLQGLRTGGFVTPAYLALFLLRPGDLLFIAVCGALTYLIVAYWLMPNTLIFGRSKVVAMIVVGIIITWAAEVVLGLAIGYAPWSQFSAVGAIIVSLLANDAERQGPRNTFIGVASATLLVWVTLVWF